MRAVIAALALLGLASPALADFWDEGFFDAGLFDDGFWDEDAEATVAVPNVVGQANAAAATAILQGEGLDAGAVIARCSAETEDEVVGQDPAPGVNVALASLVDLLVSNGIECPSGRPGVNLRGLGVGL